jgi:LPXTG-site transpeptidase (sortase) family protein
MASGFRCIGLYLAPACYIFSVLILFQYFSIHVARAFTETIPTRSPSLRFDVIGTGLKQATSSTVGLPIRLMIPRIKVNAAIRSVGLAADGSMGVPKLPQDTAWYKFGPKPGEQGSAVIGGHVDWWNGVAGVFQNLKTLKPGDRIIVENDQGIRSIFIVRGSRIFEEKEDASSVFRSTDGKSYLNLVTCTGVWNTLTKSYSRRLVVFAEKETK